MSDRIIARRYAGALYEEARRNGEVSTVDADVAILRESLADARELVRFLQSPIISRDKKQTVVERLLSNRLQPLTMRFIRLLIENEREYLLPEIVTSYTQLRDVQEGVVEAMATLPVPPAEKEKQRLAEAVERLTGKRVRLSVRQDPRILGGVIVRVGDTVYDGSVLHQLQNLREQWQPGHASAGATTDHRPAS